MILILNIWDIIVHDMKSKPYKKKQLYCYSVEDILFWNHDSF